MASVSWNDGERGDFREIAAREVHIDKYHHEDTRADLIRGPALFAVERVGKACK